MNEAVMFGILQALEPRKGCHFLLVWQAKSLTI